ncbi:MAG: 4a-hydroxytetrahydrobiopterin dehydratase [Candidatus Gracilibacteria bacterium]|nr:4a-hydroxytetrahydrobiopterin dehydratase [Candidatus Gracilibacteria bacterium]
MPDQDNARPLAKKEWSPLLQELAGWKVLNGKRLRKEWAFESFLEAIAFIDRVAGLAEEEGHHPDIFLYNYRYVQITLSTHAIDGLSKKDFILATKID